MCCVNAAQTALWRLRNTSPVSLWMFTLNRLECCHCSCCVEEVEKVSDIMAHLSLCPLITAPPYVCVLAFTVIWQAHPISHCQRVQVLRRILHMGAVWTPWLAPLRNTEYTGLTVLLNEFICIFLSLQALINVSSVVAATCSFCLSERGPLLCSSFSLPLVFIGFPLITLCLRWSNSLQFSEQAQKAVCQMVVKVQADMCYIKSDFLILCNDDESRPGDIWQDLISSHGSAFCRGRACGPVVWAQRFFAYFH